MPSDSGSIGVLQENETFSGNIAQQLLKMTVRHRSLTQVHRADAPIEMT